MKKFMKLIKEMNLNFNTIIFFEVMIDAIVVFLLFYLVLMLFSYQEWLAFFPAAFILFLSLYSRTTRPKAGVIEQKYPQLNEKLRTAIDYRDKENEIVDDLHSEVMADMRQVRVSSFLNKKKTSYKVLLSVLLCFAIVLLAYFNIGFTPMDLIKKADISYIVGPGGGKGAGEGDMISAGIGEGDEDIYGESSVAGLGDEELNLQITEVGYEVGKVRDITDADRREFEEEFPDEVFAESAATYRDDIPKEDLELVKNYFKNVAEN